VSLESGRTACEKSYLGGLGGLSLSACGVGVALVIAAVGVAGAAIDAAVLGEIVGVFSVAVCSGGADGRATRCITQAPSIDPATK
jgi:hypothetical protein